VTLITRQETEMTLKFLRKSGVWSICDLLTASPFLKGGGWRWSDYGETEMDATEVRYL